MVPQHYPSGNGTRGPTPRGTLAPLVVLVFGALTTPLAAQRADAPPDTFRDPAVEALFARAQAARLRDIEGIQSYEGTLRERIYVGITAARFRRERGLFERERVARLRWSSDGERAIHWLGARQAIPIVGADTWRDEVLAEGRTGRAGNEISVDMRREVPDDLLRDVELPAFSFDPAGDRLAFGGDWALHPLSDTAMAHYRYASGDTLRIHLPPDRDVVLYEVLVEPRRSDFHLVAGSLWFDAESASLVRATYRPARAFNLLLDEPDDAEDVPGFLQPIEAEINYITVEYSLQEFRFWLPRRFALEGEARLGRLARIPLTVEWSVAEYEVNEPRSSIPVTGPLPPGWSRREQRVEDDQGRVSYVTVLVPETRDLLTSAHLSRDFGQRGPTAFTDAEVDQLRDELQALLPTYRRFQPQLSWGLGGLHRYNRVEGLSLGASATLPLAPSTSVTLEGRFGLSDREPGGTLTLRHGPEDRRWVLTAYHRLDGMGDWTSPFSLTTSLEALLFGSARSQYYRATGASLGRERGGDGFSASVEGFYERHGAVSVATGFSVKGLFSDDDTVASVIPADEASVGGVRGELRWFRGTDPNGLILTGNLLGEVAGGDAAYRRGALILSASHPLPLGLAGALEVGGGALWGDFLVQRSFFLGASGSLRGFDADVVGGSSFWRARAELASGFAGARLALFSDAGWAGPRDDFTLDDPLVSVGVGTSLLDGLLRFDVARAVRRGGGWKVHFYLDGLF